MRKPDWGEGDSERICVFCKRDYIGHSGGIPMCPMCYGAQAENLIAKLLASKVVSSIDHWRVTCSCGLVIAECDCVSKNKTTFMKEVCTHVVNSKPY